MPERANIQIDFSGGVDQRTDVKHVVPGKLTSLTNGVFDKAGSIRKRRGFTALSRATFAGGTILAATRLMTFGSDLVMTDGDSLYSYSPAVDKWAYKDQVSQAVATRQPIAHGSTTYYSPDVAYGNGHVVIVWLENYDSTNKRGDVKATVVEVATGAQVLSGVSLATGQTNHIPRVVVVGNTALVIYGTSAGQIKARTLDLTSPTAFAAAVNLATDSTATATKFQLDATALTGAFAIIYVNSQTGANAKLNVKTFDPAALGAALASRTLAETADPASWALSIRGVTGERLWIAHGALVTLTQTVKATALNTTTLADSTAPFTVVTVASMSGFATSYPIGIERVDSANAVVTWGELDSTSNVRVAKWRAVSSGGALLGPSAHYVKRMAWLSKPFMAGSRCYAVCGHAASVTSGTESTTFLVDLTISDTGSATVLARPVTTIAPRRSSTTPVTDVRANLCNVAATDTAYVTATVVRKSAAGKLGLDLATLDFATRARHMPAELGGSLHISGGVPAIYDGGRVIENAALLIPETPYGFSQVTGSGGVANGAYSYVITFSRFDLQGQRQRSAPSAALAVTINGVNVSSNTSQFILAPLPMTLLQDAESGFEPRWYIEVWRTTASGTVFFRVPDSKIQWSGTGPILASPVLNDPTLDTIAIYDTASDADLTGAEFIYTTGGNLENRCPPSASIVAMHKERVWLAGTDDPKVLWYSQAYAFGEAPGFHDSLTITIEEGGPITALASLDGHLIVFKRDRIFFIDGDGPGLAGGAGFSTPQRISVDLGCIDANSVAVVPDGVVFQSTAGLYLLDRSLQVVYLSGPVEDTLADNPIVTSAVVHESQFQVRVTCRASVGNTGVILVYDYLAKQWSTFQVYDSVAAQGSSAIAGACNHNGVYKWVAPNGSAHQETAGAYTDDGTWVILSLETAWLKVGGLQGWQRAWSVQPLADRLSPHDFTIQIASDYSTGYAQTSAWTDDVLDNMTAEELRVQVKQQKCQSIRFALHDSAPTGGGSVGTGQGFSLAGLLLEAAVLRKAKRLPAAQRG